MNNKKTKNIFEQLEAMADVPKDLTGEPDYEGGMARNELKTAARDAMSLVQKLKESDQLPAWCQSKITMASEYIQTVKEFLESESASTEYMQETKLREVVRKMIVIKKTKALNEQKEEYQNERRLRNIIRRLIREKKEIENAPHSSTGINVLNDLLNTIIPTIKIDYKKLTSNKEQRDSFRAHIVKAIQNLLSPVDVTYNDEEELDQKNLNEEIEVNIETPNSAENPELDIEPDDSKFIDVKEKAKGKNKEETFQDIDELDKTGRNFAAECFDKIETQVQKSYTMLDNEEDRDIFYDYLLTNLKLHFDKMEDELKYTVKEPMTKQYQHQKNFDTKPEISKTDIMPQDPNKPQQPQAQTQGLPPMP